MFGSLFSLNLSRRKVRTSSTTVHIKPPTPVWDTLEFPISRTLCGSFQDGGLIFPSAKRKDSYSRKRGFEPTKSAFWAFFVYNYIDEK